MEPDLSNSSVGAVSPHLSPAQVNKKKPALMQRPKSSNIDVTGFSFARPANQPKGFTLKPIPRLVNHGDAFLRKTSGMESQKQTTRREKELYVQRITKSRLVLRAHFLRSNSQSKSHANLGQQCLEQYLADRTPCPRPKDRTQDAQIPCDNTALVDTETTGMDKPENADSATGQVIINLEAESDAAQTAPAHANIDVPVSISHSVSMCKI